MHPSLTVYDEAIFDAVERDFEVKHLADNCLFTEGPVWNPAGYYLFSDITANCIYKISEHESRSVFLESSGTDNPADPDLKPGQAGSNALAYLPDGDLLVCQHGAHGIARFDGKVLRPFISKYNDRPFNSPNDLILHQDGRIYFSDPPYGLKDGKINSAKFQPLAAVYCWKDGEIQVISIQYQYPNGVCLSPDQRTLFICSNKPFERFISTFDTTRNKFLKIVAEENSDGIECDRRGNIYLCNKDGIIILNKEGGRMALISLPTVPANICWGGTSGNDLLVTARQNVFLLKGLQR
ncbi:MAG TPA: SMP-30/gluconolactonase/LRE family protein [Flavisolibacter sp.]|nr:SMP-30/gluconolactonase/LRE family protein [Flavisolibacter sp.]